MNNKVKISEYYLPLLKDVSCEAKLKSHQYCLRAGLIKQCGSGIYTWLPLGLRVLHKIQKIIKKELDNVGLIEILMPCIQQASIWKESGRHDDYGQEMLKMTDRHECQMLFGPTNEEQITQIVKNSIQSYKQLPKIFYHIQWKFRDEIRPRFGLMRCREFLMKDAYGFDASEEGAQRSYNKMYATYLKIFKKLGVKAIPCKADAGAIGGTLNHEFHILTDQGAEGGVLCSAEFLELLEKFYTAKNDKSEEDLNNLVHKIQSLFAVTQEVADQKSNHEDKIVKSNGIEVGHIFSFGTKYSKSMDAKFIDQDGKAKHFYMSSYGIGVSRLVAAITESNYKKDKMSWPAQIAPFAVQLINLHKESIELSNTVFHALCDIIKDEIDLIYDDTQESPGIKFARADLIAAPIRIVVGKNSLLNNLVEVCAHDQSLKTFCRFDELNEFLLQIIKDAI